MTVFTNGIHFTLGWYSAPNWNWQLNVFFIVKKEKTNFIFETKVHFLHFYCGQYLFSVCFCCSSCCFLFDSWQRSCKRQINLMKLSKLWKSRMIFGKEEAKLKQRRESLWICVYIRCLFSTHTNEPRSIPRKRSLRSTSSYLSHLEFDICLAFLFILS